MTYLKISPSRRLGFLLGKMSTVSPSSSPDAIRLARSSHCRWIASTARPGSMCRVSASPFRIGPINGDAGSSWPLGLVVTPFALVVNVKFWTGPLRSFVRMYLSPLFLSNRNKGLLRIRALTFTQANVPRPAQTAKVIPPSAPPITAFQSIATSQFYGVISSD